MDPFRVIILSTIFIVLLVFIAVVALFLKFFRAWFRAFRGNAQISFFDLLSMSFNRVDVNEIVDAKIIAKLNGVFDQRQMTTNKLIEWSAQGVDVFQVVHHMSDQKEQGKPAEEFEILCQQVLDGKLQV